MLGGVLWAPDVSQLDLGQPEPGSVKLALLGPGPDGDLNRVAGALAAARAAGILADDAEMALIGATHDSPAPERRALLLQAWGMTEAAEGQEWLLPAAPGSGGPADRRARILVLGGAASGKSQLAEDLLAAEPAVTYLATGRRPDAEQDADWDARVRRHQQRRAGHWRTVETLEPVSVLAEDDEPVVLDSLGSWLTGVLDRSGAWSDAAGWQHRVDAEMGAMAAAWRHRSQTAVAVTDEVGWSVVPGTPSGRLFRDLLGQLNQLIAAQSDQVVAVVAGLPISLPLACDHGLDGSYPPSQPRVRQARDVDGA